MRPCRGMGATSPSKIPKPKQVVRKDNPQDVTVFKEGGATAKKPGIMGKRARLAETLKKLKG